MLNWCSSLNSPCRKLDDSITLLRVTFNCISCYCFVPSCCRALLSCPRYLSGRLPPLACQRRLLCPVTSTQIYATMHLVSTPCFSACGSGHENNLCVHALSSTLIIHSFFSTAYHSSCYTPLSHFLFCSFLFVCLVLQSHSGHCVQITVVL